MQSIELLAHEFGRIASMGLAGVLAAAGAISAPAGGTTVPINAALSAPVPVVQQQAGESVGAAATLIAFNTPIPGFEINSTYGYRKLPGEPKSRLHAGVDIAAPTGVPIHASAPGVVVDAGRSPTYGNYVEVEHGEGVTTFYAHMSKKAVKEGETVASGETLGYVGSTGRSTGPHLHFEVRKDDKKYDPMKVLGQRFASISDLPFVRASYRIIHRSDRG
ncbi:MAG TPA: M23 family metallopeptidase [Caulobacteraceae bacterium]|nr:M23 family metallopeptidase [Caulobacteraceae bacterium]